MAVVRLNWVARLMYNKMYGHFTEAKKTGGNNEVTIRLGSTECTVKTRELCVKI